MVATESRPAPSPRSLEWPADLLDVPETRRDGTPPLPFREFIVKIHSRCNLACDYCYIYEMADQSWRAQPATMSVAVMEQTCRRIADHVETHGLDAVQIVLHGGEPLLAGAEKVGLFAGLIRQAIGRARVNIGVQTNGILLTREFLDLFAEYDIRVGVSIDGDTIGQNRHRRYANGRGSYDRVASGLKLVTSNEYRHLFSGLLCTMDVANDPIDTYRELVSWQPPRIDYLFPHGTWATPPPQRPDDPTVTPYADWLIAVFDHWYSAARPAPSVRLFSTIIKLLLGKRAASEQVGLSPICLLVIETDGALQQVDVLKSAYAGAPETGLTVADNAFDDVLDHPSIVARQIGVAALGETCTSCSLRDVCGGGNYSHRYRTNSGFRHRSVYCPDLMRLITHIKARLETDLRAAREGAREASQP